MPCVEGFIVFCDGDDGMHKVTGRVTTVAHLYELNGSATGFGRTLGYFASVTAAQSAGSNLGHTHWEIEAGIAALVLENREVFLLRKDKPVVLGKLVAP